MDTKEYLVFAVEVGEALLSNGAEVYRVQDTILHILEGLNISESNIYVISNGIFASINNDEDISIIRNVPLKQVNLSKIAKLNALSRHISEHKISIEEAKEELENIKNEPTYSFKTLLIACGLGCAGFTYIFGGEPLDSLIGFFIGMILEVFLLKSESSKFIKNVLGASLVTLLSLLINIVIPIHIHQVTVGCIMPLVPGIALTTSVRDLFHGDYLSGTIHLLDALLTALCIGVGVGIIMKVGAML